jgi:NADPH-dependent ferric siderophore reductase
MGFTDGRKTTGLYTAMVVRTEQVSPHMVRVTFAGDDITRLPVRGFDQWFRLFLPREDGETDFGAVPAHFGIGGYIKYLTSKSGTRPPVRSYTVREHRPAAGELDVDFVAHGDLGVAGPWAQRARVGEQVALIDQGRGFDPLDDATDFLLVGDESALPAITGILRDLPRTATGIAIIEIPADEDQQSLEAPIGFSIRWMSRAGTLGHPGTLALAALQAHLPTNPTTLQAYIAGEQSLAAEGRRYLVAAGVPKDRIVFTGYWRIGREG